MNLRTARLAPLWIATAFVVSRICYFLAGVRFQTRYLLDNFQFIDVALLRDGLWESLYYFHMQPPLLNALLGVTVKAFPVNYPEAFHGLFIVAGLATCLLLYRLMLCLGVGEKLALGLTIVYAISPGTVLYENFPNYEYLMALFTLAAGLCLTKLVAAPGFWASLWFFLFLALLAWIRALYHLFFLVLLIPVIAWYVRRNRWMVVAGSLLPCLLVLALYVKNQAVFGFFGSSSWLGNNLATVTIHQLSDSEREELIQSGRLDPIARVEAPSLASYYTPYVGRMKATGIPVLDEEIKSTGGVNTNNIIYLTTDKLYKKAAKQVLRYRPQAYLRSVMIAWFCYFLPPTDFFQFEELRRPIRGLDRFLNVAEFGQFRETTRKGLRELKAQGHTLSLLLYTGTFLLVLCPVLLVSGLVLLWQGMKQGRLDRARAALLVFVIVNILFVMGTTNFLSSFENNRYRFPTDCLYLALFGVLMERAWRHRHVKLEQEKRQTSAE